MPASRNSVKGKTRHQQDGALHDHELRSRIHQGTALAPVPLEQTPAEAGPSSAEFVTNPVVLGFKLKIVEGIDQSLRRSSSPPSSRPPLIPVGVSGAQNAVLTMEEGLALIDASLPDEARAFLTVSLVSMSQYFPSSAQPWRLESNLWSGVAPRMPIQTTLQYCLALIPESVTHCSADAVTP